MPTLSHELENIYRRRFDADLDYRNQVWRTLIRVYFSRYIRRDAAVLDLGCGYGQFINNAACGRKWGMDLNPNSRGYLNPEVTFLEQDCSEAWGVEQDSLDLVFTSNFFEHLPGKAHLTRTLAEAFRCLRAGGRLIAMGPNIKFLPGAYWDFYDHHLALTELSLKEGMDLAGFRSVAVIDRFLPYTMVNTPQYPVQLLELYLRTRWVWPIFGKQFLVIAEKPD